MGLLGTVEERHPPAVLLRAAALARELRQPAESALPRLLRDPALLARHRAMLPPPRRRGHGAVDAALVVGLAKLAEADTLAQAAGMLSRAELAAVLGSAEGLRALEGLEK